MSDDVTSPEFGERFAAVVARLEGAAPLPLHVGVGAAVLMIAQLQLALRHPENRGPMAREARGFVDTLIDGVVKRVGEVEGPDAAVLVTRGLQAGFDPNARALDAAAEGWFSDWYAAMPQAWQEGLWSAIQGKAWVGELDALPGGRHPPVSVFFLPAELGQRLAKMIEDGGWIVTKKEPG